MCGIAGIIGRIGEANRAALRRMAGAMRHRGPDGEGFWEGTPDAEGRGCLLAHRRLSILDLSESAAQPMVDPPTGRVIVFNGEIYNYREIRSELEAAGHTFESSGDTAVMLRALATRGHRAVEDLRGMFAFAMWDDVARRLVMGRDAMGIKPLYVCRNADPAVNGDWELVFASEVRAILASGLIAKPRLNPAAAASVVWNGFMTGPGTVVQGVELVWAGQVKAFDGAGREVMSEFYADMPRAERRGGSDEEVAEVLRESVREHLVSDVPVGVFLSGGVDSSAVANLAQQAAGERVNTFTLAFEEAELNEGPYARRIAEAIGTNHREIPLREADFVGHLDEAIESLDQPTFDGLNSYFISRAVREAGLKVSLIGTGGDELFGGYQSFQHLPRVHRLSHSSSWVPVGARRAAAVAVAAVAGRSTGAGTRHSRWAKLPDMVEDGEDLVALYQHAYALFVPAVQKELLLDQGGYMPLFRGLSKPMYERLRGEVAGRGAPEAISVLEVRVFLGERLLRDTDAASMAVSLEVRLPLVDRPLWESVGGVKDEIRYEPIRRKMMLRRIGLAGLDPGLFDRPKSGFVLPFDRWTRQGLSAAMDRVLGDVRAAEAVGLNGHAVCRLWETYRSSTSGIYWTRIWAIYVFIRWCQRHGVLL